MHLVEERTIPIPGQLTTTRPIFPIPLNGQTFMLSAMNGSTNRCDHGRGTLPAIPNAASHTRCSCETISHTHNCNRLLLPATNHSGDQIRVQPSLQATPLHTDSWLRIPAVSRPNYESLLLNGHPLRGKFCTDSYPSLDYALLANARRKNASRETTSTLKAWLNEHKKNPYPTKGEKIMLAILSKMTLTQISTWFANARRRLKKENKMTWSPRKKTSEKKAGEKADDDDSEASDSDLEAMDVDVGGTEEKSPVATLEQSVNEVRRPSVIRAVESPTFSEIRDRFKGEQTCVTNLQDWINGCNKQVPEDLNGFHEELTPPSTPIESKVTTFSAQTLFEAFDAAKNNSSKSPISNLSKPPSIDCSYDKEPLHLLFSSKPPVCSPKIAIAQSKQTTEPKEMPSSIITPQPSPKYEEEFVLSKSISKITKEKEEEPRPEVRVQGLTTSRELEAVLALTNLCKT